MQIKERPDSWYEPDEPSDDEIWIENRVEEMMTTIQEQINIDYSWFDDCIDWHRVAVHLAIIAEKELQERRDKAAISAYEDRLNDY